MMHIKKDVIQNIFIVYVIIFASYFALFLMMYVIDRYLISIAPLELSDYVVTTDSDIVIFSETESKFYIYDVNLKLKRAFRIFPASGGAKLAIDSSNNLYFVRQGGLYRFDLQGRYQFISKVELYEPENWRLSIEGVVEHFKEAAEQERQSFSANRLRRIAMPGDILFYAKDRSAITRITDPFVDIKGNKYICQEWFYGIKVYNSNGKLISHLEPPLILKLFIIPFPALVCIIGGFATGCILDIFIRRMK